MPRDLRIPNQSSSNKQENQKSQVPQVDAHSSSKDDEDFVDIEHDDVEMQDSVPQRRPGNELALQRLSANDDEDDSEDDSNSMANHPLLSMLTGRLGQRRRGSTHEWDALHPVSQVLSPANVDDCTDLENEVFPENERCSREKFEYRLTRCPELSLGLFTRPTEAEWAGKKEPPKRQLLAHVVSTRSPAPGVTDASMSLPPDWRQRKSALPQGDEQDLEGHMEEGGTICIHSLAVAKEHQGKGLGSILLRAYIQRIKDSKCAERLALLAHDHLVGFYVSLGFQDMGPSTATFGGGNWNNMVLVFTHDEED